MREFLQELEMRAKVYRTLAQETTKSLMTEIDEETCAYLRGKKFAYEMVAKDFGIMFSEYYKKEGNK